MKSLRAYETVHTTTRGTMVAVGFILAIWLSTHPYTGVIHDARYYLLQTLSTLDSSKWSQDLYFKYGNQDSFSLFSSGYKWVIAALGINQANLAATLIGDALWLAALSFLIFSILKSRVERMAATCGVIALASGYGLLSALHYAESFVTPRLFAEAAIMGGLALAIRQRPIWASILFFLAFALHPLIAIPGIGIVVIDALRRDRRAWIVLAVALCAVAIGVVLKVEPLVRVTEFYDAHWLQILKAKHELAMISAWPSEDLARVVASWAILGAFLLVASDRERRFIVVLLVIAVGGCIASFVGADLAHNVLIMNLQPWRAMWLANLASNAVFPLLILRSSGSERIAWSTGATFSFVSIFLTALTLVTPFIILLCILWILLGRLPGERIRFLLRAMTVVGMAVYLSLAAYAIYAQLAADFHIGRRLTALTLATAAVFGFFWNLRYPASKWLTPAVISILIASVMVADQRTSWNRYVYGSGPTGGLQEFLAGAGATYWEGYNGTEVLWFKAGEPAYYSCLQGAETVFFRPLALEWFRRLSVIQHLNTEDFRALSCGKKMDPAADGPSSQAQIAAACKALPDLDTLILNHPVPGLPERSWTAPTYQEITEHDQKGGVRLVRISTFYRYSCAGLRLSSEVDGAVVAH